jgi:predicted alternative tryptophan synthase beta-subunit
MAQVEMAGDYPDIIVGCTGGGSNFAGLAFPFIGAGLRGGPKPRVIACEPTACPSLTCGKYAYDFGDTGHLTPLVKMHTLGSTFVPPGFHAGGLRYHGISRTILVNLCGNGHFDMQAYIDYQAGKLEDHGYDEAALNAAIAGLPKAAAAGFNQH